MQYYQLFYNIIIFYLNIDMMGLSLCEIINGICKYQYQNNKCDSDEDGWHIYL